LESFHNSSYQHFLSNSLCIFYKLHPHSKLLQLFYCPTSSVSQSSWNSIQFLSIFFRLFVLSLFHCHNIILV
jgi:hypothetical protein